MNKLTLLCFLFPPHLAALAVKQRGEAGNSTATSTSEKGQESADTFYWNRLIPIRTSSQSSLSSSRREALPSPTFVRPFVTVLSIIATLHRSAALDFDSVRQDAKTQAQNNGPTRVSYLDSETGKMRVREIGERTDYDWKRRRAKSGVWNADSGFLPKARKCASIGWKWRYPRHANYPRSLDQRSNSDKAKVTVRRTNSAGETSFEEGTISSEAKLKNELALRTCAIVELGKLQDELGKFSYFLWDGQLIAHLEDEKARLNESRITAAITEIAERLLKDQVNSSVKVISESLNAKLCSPGIGSRLSVNQTLQVAGMYIIHRGIVYWVSVAHNRISHGGSTRRVRRETSYADVLIDYEDGRLVANDSTMVPSCASYACLKNRPLDKMGRKLLHSVDLMIGQLPMVVNHQEAVENRKEPQSLAPLSEVRGPGNLSYSIARVLRPTPFAGADNEDYSRYDITLGPDYERYRRVVATLPGNNVAIGTIRKNIGSIYLDGQEYLNVIFISSESGVSPRLGDSGSVWVARDTCEAVAITVGLTNTPSGVVWVANLLFPCLEVLCLEYPEIFCDISQFASVRGQDLVADVDA